MDLEPIKCNSCSIGPMNAFLRYEMPIWIETVLQNLEHSGYNRAFLEYECLATISDIVKNKDVLFVFYATEITFEDIDRQKYERDKENSFNPKYLGEIILKEPCRVVERKKVAQIRISRCDICTRLKRTIKYR